MAQESEALQTDVGFVLGILGRTAIHLPEDADLADIKAHMDAGLIHIHVGKSTAQA